MVFLLSKLFKGWDFRHEPPHAAKLENIFIGWRYQMRVFDFPESLVDTQYLENFKSWYISHFSVMNIFEIADLGNSTKPDFSF